jgi:hypothetical protein
VRRHRREPGRERDRYAERSYAKRSYAKRLPRSALRVTRGARDRHSRMLTLASRGGGTPMRNRGVFVKVVLLPSWRSAAQRGEDGRERRNSPEKPRKIAGKASI